MSMKKKNRGNVFVFLSMILALAVFLSGCGNSGDEESGSLSKGDASDKTVTDAMGHEVTVPAKPERILASYLEDPLVALGITPVAQWSVSNGIQDYLQTDLKGVPEISYDLPPEAVLKHDPDFIIIGASSQVQNGLYDQYSKIAPTYVLGEKVNGDWRETLLKIGDLLNKKDEAKRALEEYKQKADQEKEKLQKSVGDKSVAILWLTQKQFYAVDATRSSGAVLYEDLGLKEPQVLKDLPKKQNATWNPISLEKLAELDADYIFLVNSDKSSGTSILSNPVWKELPAVKSEHVYEMGPKSSWLYSGVIANKQIIEDVDKALIK